MTEPKRSDVLVAEARPQDARQAVDCLLRLGLDACLAMSREEVFRWLQQRVFTRAVVAAELEIAGELLIARMSRIPTLQCLIAVGPDGDLEMEARARIAGAKAYLGRPLEIEALAMALRVPPPPARPKDKKDGTRRKQ